MISRKIRRCGNSFIVQIPKKVKEEMGFKWGDSVIILQEKDGTMSVFGVKDADEVNKRLVGKKEKDVISVRKLMRQKRQMLVVIPKGNKNVDFFKFGETVEMEMEETGELKITRLFESQKK